MQRVVGHVLNADVVPHVTPGPVGQRVELDAVCIRIVDQGHVCPRARLLSAQAGDPGLFACQRARQRLHLADVAAVFAQGDAAVHRVFAFALDKSHHRLVGWRVDLYLRARGGFELRQHLQGLVVQHASVQHEDRNVQRPAVDQVADHHVFGTQAGGLCDERFGGRGPVGDGSVIHSSLLQQCLGCGQLCVKVSGRAGMQSDGTHHAAFKKCGAASTASPW